MQFYLGTHIVNHAGYFPRTFISANVLRSKHRKSDFPVNDWILDSGAFTELSLYGKYRYPVSEYASLINRWVWCGHLELAVTQDYMCEPFMLAKTGLTVIDHQRLTIERYDELKRIATTTEIMPVLQGYKPQEYVSHIKMYGRRLSHRQRVGVGSVCKRNSNPQAIANVLEAIKGERPDLRLHGFGLKLTALHNAYICSLLYSADSMAWSFAARKQGKNPNGLSVAQAFNNRILRESGKRGYQLRFEGGIGD